MVIRDRLPKGFVLAKPIAQEGYDEKEIYELERQGRLIITRKRDGWKMLALVCSDRRVRIYTDGINQIDSRLDHIKKELRSFGFPPQTLFVGEAFVFDNNGNEDLGKTISFFHSKKENLHLCGGTIFFMVFGIIDLSKNPKSYNVDWFKPIDSLSRGCQFDPLLAGTHRERTNYVFSMSFEKGTFDENKKRAIDEGWEGLVLYDKDYQLTYRTDGKAPARPKGCNKWKPIYEDDFIVREWIPRPDGTAKELVLLQIDPKTGKEFECGKLGSFNNTMRKSLSCERYPLVVQAKFEARYPKSGKIRNARFMRTRDDKPAEQCIAPKSYVFK
ncbi:MAG: hypothetical protein A3J46_04940 [Candidatus Yanofskybacteria bacterium RIFCSPHIGHO2_02_FULL_41_11]|uniref:ATP-dependent DNA ligase family profile domain-containing protein n=1 Tax=Candidatus Yanofskybacteria bacterium RIFCSPHIGHO2_02_FULL_41_11 TaxID=1802675 RepID=A0A1F8FB75_9BACT|nr:MAG: hypothetical protein A3J46_04940 [Candidatus Yanofskybacteria bacterium RIFCSPHIGHO2_02_FULL_41_11]